MVAVWLYFKMQHLLNAMNWMNVVSKSARGSLGKKKSSLISNLTYLPRAYSQSLMMLLFVPFVLTLCIAGIDIFFSFYLCCTMMDWWVLVNSLSMSAALPEIYFFLWVLICIYVLDFYYSHFIEADWGTELILLSGILIRGKIWFLFQFYILFDSSRMVKQLIYKWIFDSEL